MIKGYNDEDLKKKSVDLRRVLKDSCKRGTV